MKEFCKSAGMADVQKHNYVLTPRRHVGIKDEIDDGIPFEKKMGGGFLSELKEQMAEKKRLDDEIVKQLFNIGFNLLDK